MGEKQMEFWTAIGLAIVAGVAGHGYASAQAGKKWAAFVFNEATIRAFAHLYTSHTKIESARDQIFNAEKRQDWEAALTAEEEWTDETVLYCEVVQDMVIQGRKSGLRFESGGMRIWMSHLLGTRTNLVSARVMETIGRFH
jgi:hypothetical protein